MFNAFPIDCKMMEALFGPPFNYSRLTIYVLQTILEGCPSISAQQPGRDENGVVILGQKLSEIIRKRVIGKPRQTVPRTLS